jgi:hypothetical protein
VATIKNMSIYKTSFILIGLILIGIPTVAQTSKEVFLSIDGYNTSAGNTSSNIVIEQRTQSQIFMTGGNDYKIHSTDKALNKQLKKEYWGVRSGDSLFVNCFQMKLGLWYAYAERINDNLFFSAAITMDKEQQQKMAMTSYAIGPIGGGISSGKLALLRFYYVMDLNNGQTTYLSKDKMIAILSSFPDLNERYKAEQEPEEIETIKMYLAEYKDLQHKNN